MDSSNMIIQDYEALHRIPEVGLELPRTISYCESVLRTLGLDPRRAGDGLIIDLGSSGPLFGWRADMDALPIQEETGLPYASTHPGRMHACGHDAHMAIALGLARRYRHDGCPLPCRLRLIFQPGEEGCKGASRMIEGGALEGVEAIAGLHVGCLFPELGQGCFGTRKDTVMASCTSFELVFTGSGTHGAYPHKGHDALQAACRFVAGLQSVRASATSPASPTVITVGAIHAGSAANVLPGEARVSGTFRVTGLEELDAMNRHLDRFAKATADAHDVKVALHSDLHAPLTANRDHALVDLLAAAVQEVHGAQGWRWLSEPTLGGEDFGAMLDEVPGVFFFFGTNPEGCNAPHHHPEFQVDASVLPAALPVIDALIRKWAEGR